MSYPHSRLGASVAPIGASLDFDGRSDRLAVAFEDDMPMPLDQRLFCLSIVVFASIPYVFVGAAAAWWLN